MKKLKPVQLRKSQPNKKEVKKIKRNPIYLVLDEVYDTYNIGSLFRLADAAAIKKIYLCGKMEYPPSSRIHKAAVGTENWVPWEKTGSTFELISRLKSRNIQIIVVEQDRNSISYQQLDSTSIKFPCAIVVGHETDGVNPEVKKLADIIVELPMYGINNSFNVWGSAAVVVYKILESLKLSQ